MDLILLHVHHVHRRTPLPRPVHLRVLHSSENSETAQLSPYTAYLYVPYTWVWKWSPTSPTDGTAALSSLPCRMRTFGMAGICAQGLVSLTKSIRMVVRELITGRATRGEDDGDEDEDSREADDEHR